MRKFNAYKEVLEGMPESNASFLKLTFGCRRLVSLETSVKVSVSKEQAKTDGLDSQVIGC